VIPGITSIQALAARHQITLNAVGQPVHITTGRQLCDAMPHDSVVVMLDGGCAFKHLEDKDIEIFWGAYLGTPDELLIAGKLRDCEAKIEATRKAARDRHGWIMDTYLLRRTVPTT
jgi:precorrin-6A synthase